MRILAPALAVFVVALPATASVLRYGEAGKATVPLLTRSGVRELPARIQEVTFTEPGGGRTFINTLVSVYDESTGHYWWSVVRGLQRHPANAAAVREATLPSWTFALDDDTLASFTLSYPMLHVRALSMRFPSFDQGDAFVKETQLRHALSAYHPVTVNASPDWRAVNLIGAAGASFGTVDPKIPTRSTVSLIDVAPENGKWHVTLKNGECERRVITLDAAFAPEGGR